MRRYQIELLPVILNFRLHMGHSLILLFKKNVLGKPTARDSITVSHLSDLSVCEEDVTLWEGGCVTVIGYRACAAYRYIMLTS